MRAIGASLLVGLLILSFGVVTALTPDRGLRCRFFPAPRRDALAALPATAHPGLARLDFADAGQITLCAVGVDRRLEARWLDRQDDSFRLRSFRWRGLLRVPEDGAVEVRTTGDDGLDVAVDGAVVASAGTGGRSLPCTKSQLRLTRGVHHLELDHVQLTGPAEALLEWRRPEGSWEVLDARSLAFQPPAPPPESGADAVVRWLADARANASLPPLRGAVAGPWCFVDVPEPPPESETPPAPGSQAWSRATTAPPRAVRHAFALSDAGRVLHEVQPATGAFIPPALRAIAPLAGFSDALAGEVAGAHASELPLCEERHPWLCVTDAAALTVPYLTHWDVARQGHPGPIPAVHAVWDTTLEPQAPGAYTFALRGSGAVTLRLAGHVLTKGADANEAAVTIALDGQPVALEAEATGARQVMPILLWQPPGGSLAVIPPAHLALPGGARARTVRHAAYAVLSVLLAVLLVRIGGFLTCLAIARRHAALHAWVAVLMIGLVVRLHDYDRVPLPGDTWDEFNPHMLGMSLTAGGLPIGWDTKEGYPARQKLSYYGWQLEMVVPMVHYPPATSVLIGLVDRAAGARSPFEMRLHWTRLVPIAASLLTLALMVPVGRTLGLSPCAALIGMAFLAVYPTAVVSHRLVKEDNLLAPLFLMGMGLVAGYRDDSGPLRRALIGACVVLGLLVKQLGISLPLFALLAFARERRWRACVAVALYAVLGFALFALYGFSYAGPSFLAVQRSYSFYATHLDALWNLLAENTVTDVRIANAWNLALWLSFGLFATTDRRHGDSGLLTLAGLVQLMVLWLLVPANLNYGWYKLSLLPVLALAWGAQTARLFQRFDILRAMLWTGLLILPAVNLLMTPLGQPADGPFRFTTEAQRSSVLFRGLVLLFVSPAFLAWLLPPRWGRRLAPFAAAVLVIAIGSTFAAVSWRWGEIFPLRPGW